MRNLFIITIESLFFGSMLIFVFNILYVCMYVLTISTEIFRKWKIKYRRLKLKSTFLNYIIILETTTSPFIRMMIQIWRFICIIRSCSIFNWRTFIPLWFIWRIHQLFFFILFINYYLLFIWKNKNIFMTWGLFLFIINLYRFQFRN